MKSVFADTSYWVGLANPLDQWNALAKAASRQLGTCRIVTSDEVLTEFLNYFAERGPHFRATAAKLVRSIHANSNVTVLPQTREAFLAAMAMYEQRQDKQYSLTDCSSMIRMKQQSIQEVLTADRHFGQEGFQVLMAPPSD